VTVLFADMKGSVELSAQLGPEEWHGIMDRFFRILADGIHRFEGTVNQYTGDGIMALFGAPIAHEDHARRACYAAVRLREELRPYAEELKRPRGVSFRCREPIVHEISAELARLRGDEATRGRELREAHRLFVEMGATGHAERIAPLVAESAR
jgi:hypothetical protein